MDILLKHYHKIIQTEEDVEALKSYILNLAISGKLNINSSKSDNANATLDIITKRKEELVKSGKIRKQKQPENIIEAELPFTIPKDWVWVRLGTIAYQIHYGHTASATDIDTGVKFLRITDIQNNKVSWKDVPYCEIDERRLNSLLLKERDILIARTGGTIGKTFLIDSVDYPSVFASYLIRVQLSEEVDEQYIKYFLESPFYWKQLINFSQGTGQPNVNATSLSNLLIPLPPVEQQENIVEKVKELFESCNQLIEKIRFKNNSSLKLNTTVFERLQDASNPNQKGNLNFAIQNVDNICNTKNDLQLLRESLLSLAVQGKLVKQDSNDESASLLIKKIENKKEQLIKEKKIRRQKKLPEITDEQKPYELPESWEWVRLGDIGDWGAGATPKRSNPEFYKNGTIPWLKTGELNDGYITKSEEKITEHAVEQTSVRLNKPGDVLIAMYGATIGKLGILEIEATTNQACCACTPFKGVYNKYLFYYLLSQRKYFRDLGMGGAQPNISRTKIINFAFPLPPLEEQKRIVVKIEELFNLCNELEKQFKNKNQYLKKLRTAILNINK